MTGLRGFTELLDREEAGIDRSVVVARIRRSVDRIDGLVRDVVDHLVGRATGLAPRIEVMDVVPVVRDLVDTLAAALDDHEVDLELEPCEVLADRRAVDRILQNLLGNAARYSPPGTTIRIVAREVPDGTVHLAVHDEGPGVPADDHERIFEPFERGSGAPAGGSGLGLATARELARRLGGDVTVTSRVGEGSTLTLVLPSAGPTG